MRGVSPDARSARELLLRVPARDYQPREVRILSDLALPAEQRGAVAVHEWSPAALLRPGRARSRRARPRDRCGSAVRAMRRDPLRVVLDRDERARAAAGVGRAAPAAV